MAEYELKVQQYKFDAVNEIKESITGVKDIFFTDYRGLTVAQITDLRNKLREKSASFKVVKNRFARIALKDLDFPSVDDKLVGPTAVALARDDSGAVAKMLFDFAADTPLSVKGGIVDGSVFDPSQVEAYSKLPSKNELYAILMGTMNAPLQNLVYAMNGVVTKLVRTLQAVADQKAQG